MFRAPQGLVAGVDEVGRGALAGPVVVAAVIFRRPVEGVADSKTLPAARRAVLAVEIRRSAIWALGAASVAEIDRLNILRATLLAMQRAVRRLPIPPERVLVDGNAPPELGLPTECIVDGDALVPVIGAASIVAKVARDALMCRLACRFPDYSWQSNVGYGTPAHLDAIGRCGLSPHHRRSFAPVRAAQLALLER
jgi:ribonuclease HII